MSSLSVLRETAPTAVPAGAVALPIGHQPCHPSVKSGSQAAVQMRPSFPVTKTSSLSVLRETAVTGAPGAARPPFSSHQPCHQSVKSGSQAAVIITPRLSVTKMSSLSGLRDTASTREPTGTRMLPIGHQPCQQSVKPGSHAAV